MTERLRARSGAPPLLWRVIESEFDAAALAGAARDLDLAAVRAAQ